MEFYRRQMLAGSMNPHLPPRMNQLKAPAQPSAAFDAWSRIAFLNSNPLARQANPLRGLLSVKSNPSLGLNRNININIAQNIHLNPTLPANNINTGRNLIAEKNTRIRNEINRMIYSNTSNLVERYACNKCNRSYRNKNHLYRHVRYECDRKKRYQCGICMKDFYRKDNLKTHISYKHSEYKSSNYILINKEEEMDDEMQLDAHNNNNLVISKNELNNLLNKNDNTQQVLSILNNSESTKHVSPTESAKQFLHLKLQQEKSKLQKSLLLKIETENNRITQSQSEVLSKLLSSKSTPVQLNLPARHLEIHNQCATPNEVKHDTDVHLIDLEENSDNEGERTMDMFDEEEDDDEDGYVQGLEPFVHIDIDAYNDVDTDPYGFDTKAQCNQQSVPKQGNLGKTEENLKTDSSVSTGIMNTPESNSELKSILTAKTLGNKLEPQSGTNDVEKKTDTGTGLTETAPKEQINKTDEIKNLEKTNTSLLNKHNSNTSGGESTNSGKVESLTKTNLNEDNNVTEVDNIANSSNAEQAVQ